MPYIEQDRRKVFEDSIQKLHRIILHPGELNYCITKLCDNFIGDDICYKNLNAVIGVLECAKNEYYRKVVAPYENLKCDANGEVYEGTST